jgi:hypothetical protein
MARNIITEYHGFPEDSTQHQSVIFFFSYKAETKQNKTTATSGFTTNFLLWVAFITLILHTSLMCISLDFLSGFPQILTLTCYSQSFKPMVLKTH